MRRRVGGRVRALACGRARRGRWCGLPLSLLASAVLAQQPAQDDALAQAAPSRLQPVETFGTTVLPGPDQPAEQIAAPVSTATDADLERARALDVTDYMKRRLGSVYLNEQAGNPLQADVNFRGYTASPLLGTPQGLSVYLDGVRLNQPFGDVVSWDLIPRAALSTLTLMPGSNPLFGLNTLGGALVLQTKDGWRNPGSSAQLTYGSWGRRALELQHGGSNDQGLSWYVTGNWMKERGWRDSSPSEVRQLFGKLGWRDARTELKLTLAGADNALYGNGLQQQQMLSQSWSSVYTRPDITENRSWLLNLAGTHSVDNDLIASGNLYYRSLRTRTFNGDINEGALDQSVYQPSAAERTALANAGYTGFPASGASAANTPFPFWRCLGQVLLNDEPGEKCNALLNRSSTDQSNWGLSGQLTWLGKLGDAPNSLSVGAAYDASRVHFQQSTQLGYLNPDRSVTGVNAFADGGVTGGNVDGVPFDQRVDLRGRTRTWSLYATNTTTLAKVWHLTVAARFNHTQVSNRDQLNPGGGADSLDGDHRFSRLNPALGLTWAPTRQFNAYVGYNQGTRAPTSIELGCANPDRPCRLPNAMQGDPPLKQVVTHTLELGVRGAPDRDTRWNLGVFRAMNHDDIQFVSDSQAGFGYFKNFGRTLRQGVEAGASTRRGRVSFGANYTYLDATYRSAETVDGSGNSTNNAAQAGTPGVDGTISVRPGDRIPLVPRHMMKAWVDFDPAPQWSVGVDMLALSSLYARGNENNAHQPDGVYYLGPGRTSGFAVFNATASYRPDKRVTAFVQIANLFDRRYATAAQLAPTGFTADGRFIARPFPAVNGEFPVQHATFFAPGAPRALWVGVRFAIGMAGDS